MTNPVSTPSTPSAAPAAPAPAAPVAEPSPTAKLIRPSFKAIGLMLLVAVVGILLVLWAWKLPPFASSTMRTDNAYVRGQITVLAPQVSGYVNEVNVADFGHVKQGDVLLRIDDRIYQEKVAQARAQLDNARAQLANSDQTQAQNRANLGARKASLSAVAAESRRAAADLQRVEELAAKGSVSLRERDQSRATSQLAKANVEKAEADIHIGEQSIKSTQVARASLEAQVKAAEAQLGLAQIDLDNTVVRAPRDGQVSESSVRTGQYVAAGSQLLFLVPDKLWVVANFKETQTAHMHVGQRASFTVDALEGGKLNGYIEQIAPATGSEFSVIKADNASGNFIKIVQRLPIRIAIDADQELAARLRPGMSVEVSVDTRAAEQAAKENAAKTGAAK
ncbi:HlyD family secretion protein [Comamonas odontotermitis]|uniref:HlyD family secretion protein n=1 Tax=Comamonas odontotermitis TaxID=379895 RepID=UPI001CC48D06|nr:HlyD family secretion protein [Comamonas odontotermitis]UBB17368.1 HlyD family secretion protein [Comamonas odontotermitis]